MRKFLVVLVLLAAGVGLARDVEYEEFNPSDSARARYLEANLRAWFQRGEMSLTPGDSFAPVAVYPPVPSDAALRRAVAATGPAMGTRDPAHLRPTVHVLLGAYRRGALVHGAQWLTPS